MHQYKCTSCEAVETLNNHPDCCSYCRGHMAPVDCDAITDLHLFDFISTPEEAWLLVPRHALASVNIEPDQLSKASRCSRAQIYALCEEEDAIPFMDRWQIRFGIINIRENVLSPNVVEGWPQLDSIQKESFA